MQQINEWARKGIDLIDHMNRQAADGVLDAVRRQNFISRLSSILWSIRHRSTVPRGELDSTLKDDMDARYFKWRKDFEKASDEFQKVEEAYRKASKKWIENWSDFVASESNPPDDLKAVHPQDPRFDPVDTGGPWYGVSESNPPDEPTIGSPPVSVQKCRDACWRQGVEWNSLSSWQKFQVADRIHLNVPVKFHSVETSGRHEPVLRSKQESIKKPRDPIPGRLLAWICTLTENNKPLVLEVGSIVHNLAVKYRDEEASGFDRYKAAKRRSETP